MGYKPVPRVYDIEFDKYPGLRLRARATTMGSILDIPLDLTQLEVSAQYQRSQFAEFAACLVEWNVEHPDTPNGEICEACGYAPSAPIPETLKAMRCLDAVFVLDLFTGWQQAITQVSAPKDVKSMIGGSGIQEAVMKKLGDLQSPNVSPELKSFLDA